MVLLGNVSPFTVSQFMPDNMHGVFCVNLCMWHTLDSMYTEEDGRHNNQLEISKLK